MTTNTPADQADPELLIATLLYLLSRYSSHPDAALAQAIVDHLQALQGHPRCRSAALMQTTRRLVHFWQQQKRDLQAIAAPAKTAALH